MLDGARVEVRLNDGNFPVLPMDKYTCQITDVDLETKEFDGEETPGIRYQFTVLDNKTIDDETGEPQTVRGRKLRYWVSLNLSNRSNLGKLVVAALGRELTKEELQEIKDKGFQPEDLIDKQIEAMVEVADGKGKNAGRQFNNVIGVGKVSKPLTPVTPSVTTKDPEVKVSKPLSDDEVVDEATKAFANDEVETAKDLPF